MHRDYTDAVYTGLSIDGPLFAMEPELPAPGPFDCSREKPTSEEVLVAEMIWKHQGRANGVNIATITEVLAIEPRVVKDIVQRLRQTHRCLIGINRAMPPGYFWIVDDEDRALAVRGMRSQIKSMFATLLVLDERKALFELVSELKETL